MGNGHGAWGMGHGAWGMGYGAWGRYLFVAKLYGFHITILN